MQTPTQPVLARYLTVGGATVAITDKIAPWDSVVGSTVTCHGCTWTHDHGIGGYIEDTEEERAPHLEEALRSARQSAQDHAETCRAMPTDA